jgi:hypothetical protein
MTNLELVEHKEYFHIFIENHLKIYPDERIDTFGLTEEICPLSAFKLFKIAEEIQTAVLTDSIKPWMTKILEDLKNTANELLHQ